MQITALDLARRYIGLREIPGPEDNPMILAMLKLAATDTNATFDNWPDHDEVPWCAGFVRYIAWLLDLPRPQGSNALRARGWLEVGREVEGMPIKGFDVVILNRAGGPQDPSIIEAPGHVGFYDGFRRTDNDSKGTIYLLGGNQSDKVSVVGYPAELILGLRRLYN